MLEDVSAIMFVLMAGGITGASFGKRGTEAIDCACKQCEKLYEKLNRCVVRRNFAGVITPRYDMNRNQGIVKDTALVPPPRRTCNILVKKLLRRYAATGCPVQYGQCLPEALPEVRMADNASFPACMEQSLNRGSLARQSRSLVKSLPLRRVM